MFVKELGWCTACPAGKYAKQGWVACKEMDKAMKQARKAKEDEEKKEAAAKKKDKVCPAGKYLVKSIQFCNYCPRGKFAGQGWGFCCKGKAGGKKCPSPWSGHFRRRRHAS